VCRVIGTLAYGLGLSVPDSCDAAGATLRRSCRARTFASAPAIWGHGRGAAAAKNPDAEALVMPRQQADELARRHQGSRNSNRWRLPQALLSQARRSRLRSCSATASSFALILFAAAHQGLITVLPRHAPAEARDRYVLTDCGAICRIIQRGLARRTRAPMPGCSPRSDIASLSMMTPVVPISQCSPNNPPLTRAGHRRRGGPAMILYNFSVAPPGGERPMLAH